MSEENLGEKLFFVLPCRTITEAGRKVRKINELFSRVPGFVSEVEYMKKGIILLTTNETDLEKIFRQNSSLKDFLNESKFTQVTKEQIEAGNGPTMVTKLKRYVGVIDERTR